jgi:TonB family protein
MKNSKCTNSKSNKSRCFIHFVAIVVLVSLAAVPRTIGQVTEKAAENQTEKEQIANYKRAIEQANEAIRKQNQDIRQLSAQVAQLQAQIKASGANSSNHLRGEWQMFDPGEKGPYPPPDYPKSALKQHLSGNVRVAIVVGTSGLPEDVSVHASSGVPVLDKHTVDWVKSKWRWPEGAIRHYYWDCLYKVD